MKYQVGKVWKIPFYITVMKIKYLVTKSTKDVKDLYSKYQKTLIKNIDNVNKWKDILHFGLE